MVAVAKNVAIDHVRRRRVRYAEMLRDAPVDHRVPEIPNPEIPNPDRFFGART